MNPFNPEVHDHLLALGYTYLLRYKNKYDEYNHPDNDDWVSIDKQGHVDFPDVCDYIHSEEHKAKVQGKMTNYMVRRIAHNVKAIFSQRQLPYHMEIEGDNISLHHKS